MHEMMSTDDIETKVAAKATTHSKPPAMAETADVAEIAPDLPSAAARAQADNLFMVGPMGAGKTTIGKRVAAALDLRFVDLDRALEAHTGADVSLIFDIEGEAGFRRRESAMLKDLAAGQGQLIATGGGSVLAEENRQLMRSRGLVIYLRASVDQQLRRLQRDKQRPLLQTPDRRQRLQALAEKRDPIYAGLADLEIVSDGRSVPAMARWVVNQLRESFPQAIEELPHATP